MNKRIFRKIIAVVLSIGCIVATNMIALAAPAENQAKVTMNGGVRTAVTSDGTYEYIVTFDTVDNTMQMSIKNMKTGDIKNGPAISCKNDVAQQTREKIHQDTFSNFEYDIYIGSPNKWRLERPKGAFSQYYFEINENSSNQNRLNTYRSAVDTLNTQEVKAISMGGTAMVTTAAAAFVSGMAVASGGVLTPEAIASVVAAVGANGAMAIEISEMGNCCNNCLYAYMDVFNNQ